MANLEALKRNELSALEQVLASSEAMMGFVPNSMLTMAHMPQLTVAFSMLAGTIFGADLKQLIANYSPVVAQLDPNPGEAQADAKAADALSPLEIQLIAYCVSLSAGCRYCQAHTSHNATRFGLSEQQLASVLDYQESEHFSASEKALIALALAAGQVPNETSEAHFDVLKIHFSSRQIAQIVAVIGLFGFLNRWNDTMATQLEEVPTKFAENHLTDRGWQVGKHAE